MSNVSIKDLKIVLGKNLILESLNLDVKKGEFVVLLGPSGCGKSTLLHSIAGLIDVEHGSLEIGGKDVTWADPKDRGIGMVFQNYALYPTMTVEKNLSFGLRISGVEKSKIAHKVQQTAQLLQLSDLLQRKPSQLSGGQRQRVAIGRALVRNVNVYLLDEPLSNLDAKLRSDLRRELKQLHSQLGATMIYVTHDQVEALTLATRIAVMKSGVIQQFDTPDEVYNRPTNMFVAGFLGSPSMNFIQGGLHFDSGKYKFKSTNFQFDVSSYAFDHELDSTVNAVLGIRPEHLIIVEANTANAIAFCIDLVEPMGAFKIVWVTGHNCRMAIQMDAARDAGVGDEVWVTANISKVSLFNAQTQQRL